eukprot:scaffold328599_cov88-Tisochrysis_lutea.AAC.1
MDNQYLLRWTQYAHKCLQGRTGVSKGHKVCAGGGQRQGRRRVAFNMWSIIIDHVCVRPRSTMKHGCVYVTQHTSPRRIRFYVLRI